MRKLFDTKAGATFYQELPNTTICMKKESMELIFKMEPGLYAIIHLIRASEGELLLLAEWGNYFDMLTNPNVQIPQIKRTCPTLYKVLVGKDEDGIGAIRSKRGHKGLGLIYKVDQYLPLYSYLTDDLLDRFELMVNKNIKIYNELLSHPPFPAWKEKLSEVWN